MHGAGAVAENLHAETTTTRQRNGVGKIKGGKGDRREGKGGGKGERGRSGRKERSREERREKGRGGDRRGGNHLGMA